MPQEMISAQQCVAANGATDKWPRFVVGATQPQLKNKWIWKMRRHGIYSLPDSGRNISLDSGGKASVSWICGILPARDFT
jgi:hypothetical protein